jgi:hypothetical protein
MLRNTQPGKEMDVDFGYLGLCYDPESKQNRKTYVFSGRLRHSRMCYREAVFDQRASTFFKCHVNCFEEFSGVPEHVISDNLKAAVIKTSIHDPIVNKVYQNLAQHYDFLISPHRPYKPEHKGGVESDIKYIKMNFWPVFKERQKALGREFPHADDLLVELKKWSEETANRRTVTGTNVIPEMSFFSEEQLTLKPLPKSRWDSMFWAKCKVARDWRIQFDKAFYSVPYKYIGEDVEVLATDKWVKVFLEHEEIACHERATEEWEYVRRSEHAPPEPEKYLQTTRQGLIYFAYMEGNSIGKLVELLLNSKPVDGLRPARGVLSLSKKYGSSRLERACHRALFYETPNYGTVKAILDKGLDRLNIDIPIDSKGQIHFKFQRDSGYFEPSNHKMEGRILHD